LSDAPVFLPPFPVAGFSSAKADCDAMAARSPAKHNVMIFVLNV